MMKNHRFGMLTLLAVIPAIMLHGARGQDVDKLTGAWKINLEVGDKKSNRIVFVAQDGAKLKIKASASEKASEGSVENGNVKFTITQEKNGQKQEAAFSGRLEGKTMSGKVTIGGKEFRWSASLAQTVYLCGNHKDPRHAADSRESMDELHDQYGCENWQEVGAEKATAEAFEKKE